MDPFLVLFPAVGVVVLVILWFVVTEQRNYDWRHTVTSGIRQSRKRCDEMKKEIVDANLDAADKVLRQAENAMEGKPTMKDVRSASKSLNAANKLLNAVAQAHQGNA